MSLNQCPESDKSFREEILWNKGGTTYFVHFRALLNFIFLIFLSENYHFLNSNLVWEIILIWYLFRKVEFPEESLFLNLILGIRPIFLLFQLSHDIYKIYLKKFITIFIFLHGARGSSDHTDSPVRFYTDEPIWLSDPHLFRVLYP